MDPLVQHPELRPIKAHIPLRLKKVSIEGAKILINKDQLIVEIKDENIEVQALGKVVSTFAFSEETFQALASVLISSGQKVTEFVAWLADSRGVTTYGPVPYNVLRSLENAFVFLQDFTPPVADLKGLYDLWKSAKREQGVVTFEIYSKTFKEYKSNIRTWAPTSYYKLQFGLPPRKVLCVDFHSKKQIAFTEHVRSSGNVRVSMCIEEKTRVDALFEMLGRLQGLVARWRRSGRPRERESK